MSISVLRTADAWWVLTDDATAARRVDTAASTTAELLTDRTAVDAAASGTGDLTDVALLEPISPVSAPCRIVAQMTNFRSHITDSGMNPDTVPLTFFRKTSGSISGPYDDIVKPVHVTLLDYEIEIGLVFGKSLPVGTPVTREVLAEYVAGVVIANDVSARDLQLPKTQFYEAKSYPTFTPLGPRLVLLEAGELDRFGDLHLALRVNGQVRQDMVIGDDIVFSPLAAVTGLSGFQRLDPGDVLLTGTPAGTALSAPAKVVEIIGSLLPPHVKWKTFFDRQSNNPKYLRDGDVVELTAATADGALDLGTQRTVVRYA